MSEAEGEDEYPDSGPFCIHYSELGTCDDRCACGHTCTQHGGYGNEPCEEPGCACDRWREPTIVNANGSLWDAPSPFWPTFSNVVERFAQAADGLHIPHAVIGEADRFADVRLHFLGAFRGGDSRVDYLKSRLREVLPAHVALEITFVPRCADHTDCRAHDALGRACYARATDTGPTHAWARR